MCDKYNVVVCSKNKQPYDRSSYVSVNLGSPIICKENEHFLISVCSFNTIKSFYSVQYNLNNQFDIVLRNGELIENYPRTIPEGNYDVDTFLVELQKACFGIIEVQYIERLNKFSFNRIPQDNPDFEEYDFYILPKNSGVLLGLTDGVEKLITTDPVYSDTFVNISGYSSLLIKIDGVSIDKSFINLTGTNYDVNKMIAIIDVANVAPMDSISLNENDNIGNKFKLNDKKIQSFSLQIVNENNKEFPQFGDFVMNIVFEKHKSIDVIQTSLNVIIGRLNDLMFYFSYVIKSMGLNIA